MELHLPSKNWGGLSLGMTREDVEERFRSFGIQKPGDSGPTHLLCWGPIDGFSPIVSNVTYHAKFEADSLVFFRVNFGGPVEPPTWAENYEYL